MIKKVILDAVQYLLAHFVYLLTSFTWEKTGTNDRL